MTASDPDRLDRIEGLLTGFGEDLKALKEQSIKSNERVELYLKASQQVVNLAFGLILTAALAIIIPVVTNR
ncbi:hypothetical protein [Acaryochloris marina]|uniref:Uncharacterized protein n=1 Tax=Acaryochloris marina (strain MBIC 11017) TaxID=329726 RepID=A8ZN44_ACAM1|nr:hypothetical protein [Acaryochloris marina]ABW32243.1 hypothetical protein AM1_C0315 [Acaryochloris marina MBIC11017]